MLCFKFQDYLVYNLYKYVFNCNNNTTTVQMCFTAITTQPLYIYVFYCNNNTTTVQMCFTAITAQPLYRYVFNCNNNTTKVKVLNANSIFEV